MVASLLLLFSCSGEDGEDGSNGTDGIPAGDIDAIISNPSGKAEAGMCKKGTIMWATSVDSGWTQTGALSGEVKENDGSFVVRGNFSGPFISYLVPSGTCYSESDNIYVDNVMMRMMQHYTAGTHNVNHATSLEFYIGEDHFFDSSSSGYNNIPAAFTLAKSEIYSYFNFSGSKDFHELSIAGDTTGDAYLLAFETVITDGRSGPEQSDYIIEIGNAILNNDLTKRAEIRQAVIDIDVKLVTDRLKAERERLGFSATTAPLWNLPFYPDYFSDLMGRTLTILGGFNMAETRTQSFGDSSVHYFALPYIFDDSVSTAKYIGISWDADYMTIYDNNELGCDGFDCPGTPLFTINKMQENFFDGSFQDSTGDTFETVPQNFIAAFGENHPPTGVKVWIVMHKDEDYNPMIGYAEAGSPIQFTAFSRNHFSDDGVNWFPTSTNAIYRTAMWRAFWTD